MSLWKVAWRSIQQRALVSMLTVVSMGLGVALVVAVLVVYGVVDQSFHRGGEGYDLIVGAKGGKEQLVLNTVFYLSQPIGNIPYSFYEELTEGKFAADVETAIPVCMGHTYQGFRVVGTVPEMFTELKYRGDQSYEFADGRRPGEQGENFKAENPFDAVMGAIAAAQHEASGGREVPGRPRLGRGRAACTAKTFHVVGVLAPTGTPVDRAIFVNMEGFYDIHGEEAAVTQSHRGKGACSEGKTADKGPAGEKGHAADGKPGEAESPSTIAWRCMQADHRDLVCCRQPIRRDGRCGRRNDQQEARRPRPCCRSA